LIATCVVSLCVTARASAQWSVGVEIGTTRFLGTTRDTVTAEAPAFRPARHTPITLRLERNFARIGVALGVGHGSGGIMEEGGGVVVEIRDLVSVYSVAPEAFVRLVRTSTAAELRIHGGPLLEIWRLEGGDDRTRLGGQAALSLRLPLADRWTCSVRGTGARIPSIFESEELPAEFERRATTRWAVSLGLAYGL
jgi:hypothetical protein